MTKEFNAQKLGQENLCYNLFAKIIFQHSTNYGCSVCRILSCGYYNTVRDMKLLVMCFCFASGSFFVKSGAVWRNFTYFVRRYVYYRE